MKSARRRARYWRTVTMGYTFGLSEATFSNLKPINYFVIMSYIFVLRMSVITGLEDYIKSEAGAQKTIVLIHKIFVR